MFSFSQKISFGLDLSDFSLKIVQLKKKKKELSLVHFIKEDIPTGFIQGGEIKKEEELVSFLKKALKKIKGESFKNKQIVGNLPEEKVFIRIIQLPKMKKQELEGAVYWEAEAHIPLNIEEVYLDWQTLGPAADHPDRYDILIAAAPRDLVDSYLKLFRKGGLEPVALEPESIALTRTLIKANDPKPTIIVDLGMSGTNFVIFFDSAIPFTSHIDISGRLFNQAIAKSLKVDEKKANQLKVKVGLDETKEGGKVYQALEPLVNNLNKQLEDYISFYNKNHKNITRILLCGGDSFLINLPAYLEKKLNLPVVLGNPLANIGKLPLSKKEALTFSTALGLAMEGLST